MANNKLEKRYGLPSLNELDEEALRSGRENGNWPRRRRHQWPNGRTVTDRTNTRGSHPRRR